MKEDKTPEEAVRTDEEEIRRLLDGELSFADCMAQQETRFGREQRRSDCDTDSTGDRKTIVGGEIKGYTEMLTEARQIATKRMVEEAEAPILTSNKPAGSWPPLFLKRKPH